MSSQFIVREAKESDVEGIRSALWEAFQPELPRTRPLALEDPAGFAAETSARTLSTIQDTSSSCKWFVAVPVEDPTAVASAVMWERVENANATPFEPATSSPWGGPAQVEVHNEAVVLYRVAVEERPHYVVNVFATHPSFQGKGAGSTLIAHLAKILDKEGMLSYLDSSPPSRRLYEKYGWKTVAQFKFPEPSTGPEDQPMYVKVMLREPGAS
ncbi:acyl-CoA N-acyltransferase [Favolaschia claudopus]|uniref:Acyl-CoA N-acyltransferase n=1 Tax=Favolaschia claudopus TaxID=2862362 RepID=A0AAW0EKI7_9AGAR